MTAIAAVKGGLFETNGVTTLTQVSGVGTQVRDAAMALSRKGQMKRRELMETLDGAAAGSAAVKTLGRVVAAEELGGLRPTENETLVNRNTTAQDVTDTKTDILLLSTRTTFGSSAPANLDGNPLGTR